MDFTYSLRSIGWADVHIKINKSEVFIDASYLSEPLIDMVRAIERLIPECVEADEISEIVLFEWDSEPAIHRWVIQKLSQDLINIEITLFVDGITDDKGEILLNEQCNFKEFVFLVVKSMEKIIRKHGIVGYRKQWNAQDFPLSSYIQLKHYLKTNNRFPVDVLNKDEWIEAISSNINDEVEVLLAFDERIL